MSNDEAPQQDSAPAEAPPEVATDAASVPVVNEHSADGAGGEAAKFRHKLRDTEKQLDTMTQRVEAMQRGEAERLASKLADPADLWRDGAQLADVLDEAGTIDAAKVAALTDGLLEQHSHWAAPVPQQPRRGGYLSGASTPPTYPQSTTWASALRPTD